jgi:hypothetical protein
MVKDVAFSPQRAVKEIATLQDAVRAVMQAGRGDPRPLAAECERLGVLLVQSYNQLLGLAVAADARHGTQLRFDAVQALEPYDRELADAGVCRNGEGGLSLSAGDLAAAVRERPTASSRALRESAGACACLSGWLCRALAGLAQSPAERDFRAIPPSNAPDVAAAADADKGRPGPGNQVFNLPAAPHADLPAGRPTFYA